MMHFGPNECTQCGMQRTRFESKYTLPEDGVLARLDEFQCAFCSDRCFERAIGPYVNQRFGPNKEAEGDPNIRVIVQNIKKTKAMLADGTLRSTEERSEIEAGIKQQIEGLKEAVTTWHDAQGHAIAAAAQQFISQWAQECASHHKRGLDKALAEARKQTKREQREDLRLQERAERDERLRLEREQRDWDRDYKQAWAEHEKILESEAKRKAEDEQWAPRPFEI